MARWATAQNLAQEDMRRIQCLYNDNFPIEVRHYLADWIEEHFLSDPQQQMEPNNFTLWVKSLIESFIQEIENRSAIIGNDQFLAKMKLAEAAAKFKLHCKNYQPLYDHIRRCLLTEEQILQISNGMQDNIGNAHFSMVAFINQQLEELRLSTQQITELLRHLEQEQEQFAINYHDCTKVSAALNNLANSPATPIVEQQKRELNIRKQEMEQQLTTKIGNLLEIRLNIVERLTTTYAGVNDLQTKILDEELIKWKREQQLAGNGAVFSTDTLNLIQEWCESLADLIWHNRHSVKEFERIKAKLSLDTEVSDNSSKLLVDFTQLLSSLVTSTFIIEKQPPQVMKTNTRFTATVRLLVGGKLNVYMSPPQVRVTIISEMQANVMLKNDKLGKNSDVSGEILNSTGAMEYQASSRQLSVSFRNMQLKKIKRAEKKGTESVMDEKFSLLFQSNFCVGGGELMFQVWTLSLPVVVIVHGNQEPHAWATVTWDNAFSEPGRAPFAVPDKVPWCKIADTLSLKFQYATGRPLDEGHLRFLGEKAFRGNMPDQNQLLSWPQFCKEPLPDRNFTFWEWFYAVMKLTKEHLRGPWIDGAIMGFIRKRALEEMLQQCSYGTFALRFSDSELGGITIAWVHESMDVSMIQPYTAKDFSIRSLPDRISDLTNLLLLYPNVNKDDKFGKYYTPQHETPGSANTTNGYVKSTLKVVLNNTSTNSVNNTPQHVMSPEYSGRDTNSVVSLSSTTGGNLSYDDTNFNMGFNDILSMDSFSQ